jgi:hypothetical protein
MAAPNLISTTNIVGKTQAEWITTTPTAILTNANNSSTVLRINVLFVTNRSGASATATVEFYRGAVAYHVVSGLIVDPNTTSIAIGKDTSIYLEEGDALRITANQNGVLQYVVSYEVMS